MKPTKPIEPAPDIADRLDAIARQRADLDAQEQQLRKQQYDDAIAVARAAVTPLVRLGHDPATLAKALGLVVRSHARSSRGPSTFDGWFKLFRSRGIQVYLNNHPELKASVRGVLPADIPPQIPPDALAAIDARATTKAQQRALQSPRGEEA